MIGTTAELEQNWATLLLLSQLYQSSAPVSVAYIARNRWLTAPLAGLERATAAAAISHAGGTGTPVIGRPVRVSSIVARLV